MNNDGKGVIKINYIGGPRAVPPFEVGNAVRTRVVDIANVTGAFYTNLMPEADGFKLIGKPMSEQRKNGTWEYINQLHNQKLNSQYLARQFHNVPFHIYLNKKIDKIDFSGLKIRVTPVYRDVVEALGGTPITTAPGEVYTALERGVVDGYGWPVTGIFDLGWEKVTKFRMEPAFYSVEVNVLVNLDAWKGLNDAQRKVLNDAALWLEGLDSEKVAVIKAERERQAAAGIQALDFGPAASQGVPRQGLRRGLAIRHQARAGERPEAAAAGGELRAGRARTETPLGPHAEEHRSDDAHIIAARAGALRCVSKHEGRAESHRTPASCETHRCKSLDLHGAPQDEGGTGDVTMTRLSLIFGKLFDALAVDSGADPAGHGRHRHRRHRAAQHHAHRHSSGPTKSRNIRSIS